MLADTIVAISTPMGKGAIGLIRLSGLSAFKICQEMSNLSSFKSHKVYHAYIIDIDEVLLTYFKAPHTYTGEDVIEISCHNNMVVMQAILSLSQKLGARLAKPGEFTERAFLNGKLDLTQAEAVLDVIHAESTYSEQIAQKQLKGGLSKQIEYFRIKLLNLLKDLEVVLDHEDIIDFDRSAFFCKLKDITLELKRKIKTGERVNRLCHGLDVALVGRPNVGKSSLLNTILDKEKSIVSKVSGTTRDAVEAVIEHQGIRINLIDTAGLKHATEFIDDQHAEIERQGIIKTNEYIAQADYVFLIVDLERYDPPDLTNIKDRDRLILVGNKDDLRLISPSGVSLTKYQIAAKVEISVSAKTGKNIEKLLDICIDDFLRNSEVSESKFVVNNRHQLIFNNILLILDNIVKEDDLVVIAMDIRQAVNLLAEILGIDVTEAVLDLIFSDFCIGK